jgi:hypothetical protein
VDEHFHAEQTQANSFKNLATHQPEASARKHLYPISQSRSVKTSPSQLRPDRI